MNKSEKISVVIATYNREQVLLDTISYLLNLPAKPDEIIIVDQTKSHEPLIEKQLEKYHTDGNIKWIRLLSPSVTHAMNVGLLKAYHEIVLFLDDDIIPEHNLIKAHLIAHQSGNCNIVAGRVLQPWDTKESGKEKTSIFYFNSQHRQFINEFMGGNFSINKNLAKELGGFDENFTHAAYRFEAEFSDRAISASKRILFEPEATIHHIKFQDGGIRSYGHHLTTAKPGHSVGEYYFLLISKNTKYKLLKIVIKPFRSLRTKHHLRKPWWILPTLLSEFSGFILALKYFIKGPKLIKLNRQ